MTAVDYLPAHVDPEPTSLVAVSDQCDAVERWAQGCDSVPQLRDASNKLAAIDEYLSRTSIEGRARVAATQRRLEVRIGELLPARKPGPSSSVANDDLDLSRQQRHEFRRMAEHADEVEQAIAESSDESPASRRKVIDRIKGRSAPRSSPRKPLNLIAAASGIELRKSLDRVQQVVEDDRYQRDQTAVAPELRGHLTYAIQVCQDLLDRIEGDGTR